MAVYVSSYVSSSGMVLTGNSAEWYPVATAKTTLILSPYPHEHKIYSKVHVPAIKKDNWFRCIALHWIAKFYLAPPNFSLVTMLLPPPRTPVCIQDAYSNGRLADTVSLPSYWLHPVY